MRRPYEPDWWKEDAKEQWGRWKRLWLFVDALLLVAAAGAAAGLALWDYTYPAQLPKLWNTDTLFAYHRLQLERFLAVGAGVAVVLWLLATWRRLHISPWTPTTFFQRGTWPPFVRWARRLARGYLPLFGMPLIGVRYLWTPLGMGFGSSFWTYVLILPLAFTLAVVLVPWLERNERPPDWLTETDVRPSWRERVRPAFVVIVGILLYLAIFGGLSAARHLSFRSHALDLGTMAQAAWNTAHGRWLEYTPMPEEATTAAPPISNRLTSGKAEFIFLLIAPLYRLWPDPLLLLFIQTALLGLSAWPLFLAFEKVTDSGRTAALLALAYLAYLPLHYVNMADFHPSALAPFFLAWMLYASVTDRWRLYALALVLALACRVDVAFALAGLALAFMAYEQWRVGLFTLLAAVAWFLVDFYVIVPWATARYGPDPLALVNQRFGQYGETPLEIARTLAQQPRTLLGLFLDREKVQTLFDLFMPVGGVALLAPVWLVAIVPLLLVNLLADSAWQGTVQAHYFAPILPFIFFAAAIAIRIQPSLRRDAFWRDGTALYVLLSALLVGYFFSPFPPGKDFHLARFWVNTPHQEAIRTVLTYVQPESRLSGQSDLVPHVANRRYLYLFPVGLDDAEEVLLDLDNGAERAPLDYFAYFDMVNRLLANPEFGVVAWENGVVLLRRGWPHDANAIAAQRAAFDEGFYRLTWLDHTTPHSMQASEFYPVRVCFRNDGTQSWRSEDWYPVFVAYHWLTPQGDVVQWESERVRLPYTLYPTQSLCLRVPVVAPETVGDYILQFDLVREHQYWFAQKGAPPLDVAVSVVR